MGIRNVSSKRQFIVPVAPIQVRIEIDNALRRSQSGMVLVASSPRQIKFMTTAPKAKTQIEGTIDMVQHPKGTLVTLSLDYYASYLINILIYRIALPLLSNKLQSVIAEGSVIGVSTPEL